VVLATVARDSARAVVALVTEMAAAKAQTDLAVTALAPRQAKQSMRWKTRKSFEIFRRTAAQAGIQCMWKDRRIWPRDLAPDLAVAMKLAADMDQAQVRVAAQLRAPGTLLARVARAVRL
jgi:hypothetical protein